MKWNKQFCVSTVSRIRNSECELQQQSLGGRVLSSKISWMWEHIIQEDGGLSTPSEDLGWYIAIFRLMATAEELRS